MNENLIFFFQKLITLEVGKRFSARAAFPKSQYSKGRTMLCKISIGGQVNAKR